MSSIITAINGVSYILIFLFLSRMILNPRDFYFNAILRPVDIVTSPVLNALEQIFPRSRSGLNYTPVICILLIYILKSVLIFFLAGGELIQTFISSFGDVYQILFKLFLFSVFVKVMVSKTMTNPIYNFFAGIVESMEKIFGFFTRDSGKRTVAAVLGVIFVSGIVYGALLHFDRTGMDYDPGKLAILAYLYVLIDLVSMYNPIIFTLIFSVLLSWISLDIRNPIVNLTYAVTEPMLRPLRKVIPAMGSLDLTPWVAGVIIFFIGRSLLKLLAYLMIRVVAG